MIRVNETTHQAWYGLNYFEFGQISKFVAPGAVRIASTRLVADDGKTVTPGVDDVAFINPNGKKVLTAYNSATDPGVAVDQVAAQVPALRAQAGRDRHVHVVVSGGVTGGSTPRSHERVFALRRRTSLAAPQWLPWAVA